MKIIPSPRTPKYTIFSSPLPHPSTLLSCSPHLSIHHVGYHHDTVSSRVWELQRQLSSLYVKCAHNRLRAVRLIFHQANLWVVKAMTFDLVPVAHVQLQVYGHSHMVRDVMLTDVEDVFHLVCDSGGVVDS